MGLTPILRPGPTTNAQIQKIGPQSLVLLSVGSGSGLTTEGSFDRPFIEARCVGKQNDFEGAEFLAKAVDRLLLDVGSPMTLGSTYTLYITRTGGGPQLAEYDTANRYHFACSYIAEAETGR
jgi:hypothetical protein